MTVHKVNSVDEYKNYVSRQGLVVVDYFATWCGPCNMIAPKLEEFSEQLKDVLFIKVDVDSLPSVADTESVRAMPTFKLFLNGKEIKSVVGANFEVVQQAVLSNRP
ncbi:thioredoxin H-type [Cryptosporidium ubiquitum]|uniref:Thioredoxin n=1 Tax=Cryptosporidium ubiquitum TaxID=857276 RepID=A0A1J4MEL8_9CRYT|nr:thioredoxin H-type [Cryptosporidium ubiquitum]OII72680.1 thioredoxin H-type [Cryptosporidium ubiquitum]